MTPELPTTDVDVNAVQPKTLKQKIDDGESITLLDVRSEADVEEWSIESEYIEQVNIPYYEFLDGDQEALVEQVPDTDDPVIVLCGKGESSAYVAGVLQEHGVDARNLADGMEGWARIYESYRINEDPVILQYQRPSSGCLSYMVISDGEAAVVDPLRAFTDRYVDDAEQHDAQITHVIDTHVHADHISGLRSLADQTGSDAILSERAVDRGVTYDDQLHTVEDGNTLSVGNTTIDVIATPGHTTGMTAFHVDDVLFTGDGLFTESVARPDLEEGDEGAEDAAAMLHTTLHEKVLPLPDETLIAPGHFSDAAEPAASGAYVRQLDELMGTMDVLDMGQDAFVEYIISDMPPRPANYEDIIATNLGQQEQTDDEAFELELGPNNCAASTEAMTA